MHRGPGCCRQRSPCHPESTNQPYLLRISAAVLTPSAGMNPESGFSRAPAMVWIAQPHSPEVTSYYSSNHLHQVATCQVSGAGLTSTTWYWRLHDGNAEVEGANHRRRQSARAAPTDPRPSSLHVECQQIPAPTSTWHSAFANVGR